ncbi:MAG: M91 family zinc metallopeptidase [Vulcanimicrobiota bacterium]
MRGRKRFLDRVKADIDALRSFPEGRDLLRRLDASGKRVTVRETMENDPEMDYDEETGHRRPDGRPGAGSDSSIKMFDGADTDAGVIAPTAVTLGHELAHAVDAATGTMATGHAWNPSPGEREQVEKSELDAVGLDYPGRIPLERPAENDLRRALLMPRRQYY